MNNTPREFPCHDDCGDGFGRTKWDEPPQRIPVDDEQVEEEDIMEEEEPNTFVVKNNGAINVSNT